MNTARKTPTFEPPSEARLSGSVGATRSLTVRLPVDLYEHLKRLAHAGAVDKTKALVAVLRMHRDGTHGIAEMAKLATSVSGLNRQVGDVEGAVYRLRDEISLIRGRQGKTLDDVAKTLVMLFELLRDGESIAEAPSSSGVPPCLPAPSSRGLQGDSNLAVQGKPVARPVPTPFGTQNR